MSGSKSLTLVPQPEALPVVLPEPPRAALGTVTIVCGADEQKLTSLEPGVTAGEVADRLRQVMNIPEGATMFARGREVGPDYTLVPGDTVEFIRQAGRKAVL